MTNERGNYPFACCSAAQTFCGVAGISIAGAPAWCRASLIAFITAGSANQEVPAKSVFVPSLLRALQGEADRSPRDGYVSGSELGEYLLEKVPYYNPSQTPQYGKIRDPELDMGDFVFCRNIIP